MVPVRVTDKLPNGATVIDIASITGPHQRWVVLCIVPRGQSHEYVTWEIDPDTLAAYWGHYHGTNLSEAVEELYERAQVWVRGSSKYTDTEANKMGG